ncbi:MULTISPECIES: polymorphic toxin-type HINT domain-containing protein [Streptomyces]|uniref:Polymorphic toxin-type HINT domain-containing protein n=3 Tax=Streptomyces TaxID=1883 RepID=A0ABZ1T564_STRVG|nr:polymorphic toxin-type HINT domain-containing protein [Streptomyces virginiae]WTB20282.1 polymorphic toxin-type HINT domain-containing protein [Streptomyces virginiae]
MARRAGRVLLPLTMLAGLVSAAPAAADEPATPPLSDRQRVVNSWKAGGPAVKAAAGSALVGTDEQLRAYLAQGQKIADDLDLREAALKLVTEAGPGVSEAARKALDGTPEQLAAFMKDGWKAPLADDQRLEAARITEGGGLSTREAGDKAMAGSLEDIKAFLTEGQYKQRDDDARLRVAQIEADGGPATKRAAGDALSGSIDDVRDFLTYGQHITRAQDQEHATITDLAQQTKNAQAAAEKARKSAEEQAQKAKTSAALAKQETAKAAAETKAAKGDARRAADAARRAAESARRAASAARTAVAAARAANAAAQAAATAAHNASTAALYASQAADGAWAAANSGKVHEDIAAAADRAAADAMKIADSADAMRETLRQSNAALEAALSAINDMTASAGQADDADKWARESGVHYGEAKAAANSARRHAAEAKRASEQARAHANAAATAAQESATAARSAAAHARNAATAARKAAEHAGDAQAAADKAKANAAEALAAAQRSGEAVKQIESVQDKARAREAEEVKARTATQVNEAADAKELYDLAKAEMNRLLQERNKLEGDFAQLAIQAEQPGANRTQIAATGRKMALTALQVHGPWSRSAAEAALAGDDAAVIAYATDGWKKATEQDERQQVNQIALTGGYKDLRAAAATALTGDAAQVRAFLATGQYQAAAPDRRVEVARIEEAGGTVVKEAASAALDNANPKALNDFLEAGQHRARLEDDRVAAARLAEGGTPEVKAAAETALASPDTQLRTFVESGQHRAKRRDQLNTAHIAQIKAITAAAHEASSRAYEDAFKAAQAASDAQKDANAAREHAEQATKYANEASGYATQAKQSADNARKSSNEAAASAATARNAEVQAARSAASAEQSAASAYASSLAAADYAASAFKAAEAAKTSAINAGMSNEAAQIKHAQTVQRFMIDEYNREVQKRQAEEAAAKKRNLIKIGTGVITFLTTGMLPPDMPLGVRLDLLHGTLDILGMIPGVGEIADGANCAIYAVEGTVQYFHPIGREGAWLDAGLACASMVPFAGWGTTPLKWARYGEKYGPDAKKLFDDLSEVFRKAPPVCPVGRNSFPAGTPVLMGDGSARPIEKIRVGDFVQAADPETGTSGPRRVEATIYTPDDRDFTDITLAGKKAASVTATAHHPFWSQNTRTWTDAADLKAGDTLLTAQGATAKIGSVRHWRTLQPAYNLTVDDLHTYYVLAGRTPVLVHNTGGPVPCPQVPWITSRLPAAEEAALNDTLAHITANTVPTGPTSIKWGTKFNNRDVDLPGGVGEHSPYLEYRVAPPAGTSGPGPLRVVRNQFTGETYYTWTHYGDSGKPAFVRVR